jgi:hypothetical protein
MADIKTWGDLLDRFGLPILFLFVMGLFIWKGLWPLVIKALSTLEEQVREARQARQSDTERFLGSLNEFHNISRKQTEAIEKLTASIDDLRDGRKR